MFKEQLKLWAQMPTSRIRRLCQPGTLSTASQVALSGKEPACQSRRGEWRWFDPWVRKIPWRRKWQRPPKFLPGESHGQRGLEGYSPWGCTESDNGRDLACTLSTGTMTVQFKPNQQSSRGELQRPTYLSQILKYPVGKRCCQQYWSSSVWKTFSLCFSEEMWPCHCFSLLQFFPHIQQWKSTCGAKKTRVASAAAVWGGPDGSPVFGSQTD